MYYTYVLQSLTSGRYYIGQTSDLSQRLDRHKENLVTSTKNRCPWKLVYSEHYSTRSEAIKREKYLKSLKKRQAIEQIIAQSSESRCDLD